MHLAKRSEILKHIFAKKLQEKKIDTLDLSNTGFHMRDSEPLRNVFKQSKFKKILLSRCDAVDDNVLSDIENYQSSVEYLDIRYFFMNYF